MHPDLSEPKCAYNITGLTTELIQQLARECGFELAGVAAAIPLAEAAYYRQWVAAGYAGEMKYLTDRRAAVRDDPRNLLPSAKSIICVGKLYNGPEPYSTQFNGRELAWISRYAWGEDYHDVLRAGLGAPRRKAPSACGRSVRMENLRGHRASARARLRTPRRSRLDRQEHLPHQPADGLVVLPRRAADVARARTRHAAARSLRHLHALHRRLSHGGHRARRAFPAVPNGPSIRACASRISRSSCAARFPPRPATNGQPRLRLRHLPGRLPLEFSALPLLPSGILTRPISLPISPSWRKSPNRSFAKSSAPAPSSAPAIPVFCATSPSPWATSAPNAFASR